MGRRTYVRIAVGLLAIAAVALLIWRDGDDSGPPTIEVIDFAYEPLDLVVKRGKTVSWENIGEEVHTVTGKSFSSDELDPADRYEHRFDERGSYRYVCRLHPQMMGLISVE